MTPEIIAILIANVLGWPIIHIACAWGGTQLRPDRFNPEAWLFRTYWFERTGAIYERLFRIKQWKHAIPDGAAWFKAGFPKRELAEADVPYLKRFLLETCRAELVHWAVFLAAGIFFLWNEVWVGLIMVAYGAVANVPCIVIQRYNRARLRRVIARRSASLEVPHGS